MITPRLSGWKRRLAALGERDGVRLALIAAGIVLAAGSVGGVVYLQEPQDGPRTASLDSEARPRLPRPRPEEPATTGSIAGRSAKKAAEPASAPPAAFVPFAETQRVEDMRKNAMVLASSWENCGEGVESQVLGGAAADSPVVIRVECGNGARFYLDQEEIERSRQAASGQPILRMSDKDAIAACEEKLKFGLPIPSSFSRLPASTGVVWAPGDGAVVTFDFDAKNGLGFPLAMQVQCLFQEREIARLETRPR